MSAPLHLSDMAASPERRQTHANGSSGPAAPVAAASAVTAAPPSPSPSGASRGLSFSQLQLQPMPATASRTGHTSTAGQSAAASDASLPPPAASSITSLHFNFNGGHLASPHTSDGYQVAASDATNRLDASALEVTQMQPPLAHSATFHPSDSFTRSVSPLRSHALADASFHSLSSVTHSQLLGQSQSGPSHLHPRNAAAMSDMLQKARDGLHKLAAELETERQRRQTAERELTEARRELSNERLAGSSNAHSVQLQHDKESRLLRELAAQKLLEASLRTQVEAEVEALTHEKEERIRLEERLDRVGSELRTQTEMVRAREEELAALRKQHAAEQARSAAALQESSAEARRAQEELRQQATVLQEQQAAIQTIDAQMTQMDNNRVSRENARQLEEQRLNSRIAELQTALEQRTNSAHNLQASVDALREENERLSALAHESAKQMQASFDAERAEAKRAAEEKVAQLTRRIDTLQEQEQSLARLSRESAVSEASLRERLASKSSELEVCLTELAQLKEQNILLAAEHQHHLDELQANHESHLADIERSVAEREHAAQEQERSAFEVAMHNLEREVERAMGAAVQAALEPPRPAAAASSAAASLSPAAFSPLDAASSSLSPRRSRPAAPHSFYASSLLLLKDQLLQRLASTFEVLHTARSDTDTESLQAEAALHQQVADLQAVLQGHEEAQRELARKLTGVQEAHAHEVAQLRAGAEREALLLEERASVIRELKRRYRREQSNTATLTTALAQARQQLSDMRASHASDLTHWRDISASELSDSIRGTEHIAARRLEAENRLRRKAEEEADSYVRACQQSEQKVLLLQQQQAQLVAFFKQQMSELTRPHTAAARATAPPPPPPAAFPTSSRGAHAHAYGNSNGSYSAVPPAVNFEEQLDRFMRSANISLPASMHSPASKSVGNF